MNATTMKSTVVALTTCCLMSNAAWSQEKPATFPDKPVRIILPFASGGSTDNFAHAMQPRLESALGQKVILERIAGGIGGSKGPEAAAAMAPDGYTMLLAAVGNIALLPSAYPKYGIVPLRDFVPVTQLAELPNVLVARSTLPVASFEALVKAAKDSPDTITYPSFGITSIHGVEFSALMQARGIKLRQIPNSDGSGGAMKAIVAGKLDLVMTTAPYVLPHVRSGAIKALAIASPQRSEAFPGIPTMIESGVPLLSVGSWMGLFVPLGTPAQAVEKLFQASRQAAVAPDVVRNATEFGMDVKLSYSPAAFRTFVENETSRLKTAFEQSRNTQ